MSDRISSTELLDAASSSWMFSDRCSLNARQDSHSSHASPFGFGLRQFIVLANILAQVVFPTPRGPQKRYACASLPVCMAFLSVVVSAFCPATVSKDTGRYLRAETM